jgi:ankyrin repeat protein
MRVRVGVQLAPLLVVLGCASVPRAAHDGNLEAVNAYLAEKGSANDRFDDGGCAGCTLLHHAAGGGRVDVIRVLLERGADPNAQAKNRSTPLHVACRNVQVASARALLQGGAGPSLSVRDAWGNTPLLLAAGMPREQDAWVFTAAGAIASKTELAGGDPLVALLLEAGADVRAATDKGNTALHLAAYRGYGRTVALLLAWGADRTVRNSAGATAEDFARAQGREDIVKLLRAERAAP